MHTFQTITITQWRHMMGWGEFSIFSWLFLSEGMALKWNIFLIIIISIWLKNTVQHQGVSLSNEEYSVDSLEMEDINQVSDDESSLMMIMTMMAMNKDLLSRIVTFICLTLSFWYFDFRGSITSAVSRLVWPWRKQERTSLFVFLIGKEENRNVGECKDSDKGGCLYLYLYLCDWKRRK